MAYPPSFERHAVGPPGWPDLTVCAAAMGLRRLDMGTRPKAVKTGHMSAKPLIILPVFPALSAAAALL